MLYQAIDATPLTLRLVGAELRIVDTNDPFNVLASQPLIDTLGVKVLGAGFDVASTIDQSMLSVPDGVSFEGGAGNNMLIGPNVNSDWIINGYGEGGLVSASGVVVLFDGIENLQGGFGVDTFKIDPGGLIAGSIQGGVGNQDALVADNLPNTWQNGRTQAKQPCG